MTEIYYGIRPHPWAIGIENWNLDAQEKLHLESYKNDIRTYLAAEN